MSRKYRIDRVEVTGATPFLGYDRCGLPCIHVIRNGSCPGWATLGATGSTSCVRVAAGI